MIGSFVKRPATTIMFVLFFVILGLVSFIEINVEQSPRIDLPLVVVNVVYPGASPLEIETQAIKKIEDSVVEISEIKKIESRSFESAGYVMVEFYLTADVNNKLIEVKDKVEAILNELPDDMDRPIVQKVDPFSQPVVDLILTSKTHSPTELYEFADVKLKNQFSKITGVGQVDIFGGRERQIRVELFPDLMKQYFISIDKVIEQMKSRNLTVPAGSIDRSRTTVDVRFEGEFESIEEIANLRLTTSDGNSFPLSQIARVYDGASDKDTGARFNGQNVVSLSVKKIADGNDIRVASGVRKLLPQVKSILEDGMSLEIALDRSEVISRETQNTFNSVLLGIILTIFVLLFFTGDWRVTVISAIVIPTSIVSAMFGMEKSGFTINFITLLAIATSLGTLIANAIVIIESILEYLDRGDSPVKAAVDGTKAVVVPVLAAGGTNLVVFTPIAFMGGLIGQFMLQFGMTVVYATIFSLIASFSLTPMLCALLLRPKNKEAKKNWLVQTSEKFVNFLLAEYKLFFDTIFRFPKTSIIVVVILFIGAFTVVPYVGNEFIPTSDRDRLEVVLTMPLGTRVEESEEVAKQVEVLFKGMPEVESVLTILGQDGEQNASVIAILVPGAERSRADTDLIEIITPKLARIPNAEVEIKRGDGGGGRASGDISINISGNNYDEMVSLSQKVMKVMKDSGYFRSVTSSYKTPKEEMKFFPNASKIEKYGLTSAQIGSIFRSSIYGDDTNIFRENGEEYDIVVKVADEYINSTDSMKDLFIISNTGLVPVTELGDFKMASSVPTILRRDRHRVIQLNGFLAKSTAGVVQSDLTKEIDKLSFNEGASYVFVGNAESQEESGQEIMKAFLLAIILTYMILAAIMNSFVHPFTIATSIITSFSGVFLILFFLDFSINIASMLGFVMLVGLAVNNAILILEEVEVAIEKNPNIPIHDALWLGIKIKFRAVLMTSVAIVFGALPQLWDTNLAKAAMGAVIVGGVLASIFFTFFLTPQTYFYLERLRRWVARKVGSKPSNEKEQESLNAKTYSPDVLT
ncbi:MAG: hypothetical protein CL676_06170 [Bdellovibrionaceae bacterium]|nr:hypothetical protein [Pseudobdellovibrionaceae bacterium]|tara:strand:- start:6645 stop:9752 length:3108 start_codon:yes stop_codon:yes gene_type:complete